jgi:hypothetical protein
VASSCTGAATGVTEANLVVTCMLNGSKRYLCKDANTNLWWCVSYGCSGQTIYGVPCAGFGTGGCLTPMWD